MAEKALTIQKVDTTDIELFHEKRTSEGKTPAGYFHDLLHNQKKDINGVKSEALQDQINSLTESLVSLQAENHSLLTDKQALQDELEKLKQENAKILAVTEEMTTEINDLKNREPEQVQVPTPLSGLQFICEPSDEAYKIARKFRSFLRKDGIVSNDDDTYASELFSIAVPKYLKNRYE